MTSDFQRFFTEARHRLCSKIFLIHLAICWWSASLLRRHKEFLHIPMSVFLVNNTNCRRKITQVESSWDWIHCAMISKNNNTTKRNFKRQKEKRKLPDSNCLTHDEWTWLRTNYLTFPITDQAADDKLKTLCIEKLIEYRSPLVLTVPKLIQWGQQLSG